MTSIDVSVRSRTTPPKSSKAARKETKTGGIAIDRYFTKPGVDPYDTCEWELRNAGISSESGASVFEQKDVEMPKFWSQMATNVVVSKYFRGHLNTPGRETSVSLLVMNSSSTGMPSFVFWMPRWIAGMMSSGFVTRSP